MTSVDALGCPISGAAPAAVQSYERALAAFQGWRSGTETELAMALQADPRFVMAHVLQAYVLVSSRDPRRVRSAQAVLIRMGKLALNERERLHVEAIKAVLADDYEQAHKTLAQLLRLYPLDVLALQASHAIDYASGNAARMHDCIVAVLPAWSSGMPSYNALLAMHAFALVECGEYDRAEETARTALAASPGNARAHHVMAHVFEMTGRAGSGARWLGDHVDLWRESTVATHCWWHLALFQLTQDRCDRALTVYDRQVRATRSKDIADLIDASALLWRIELAGCNTGWRWAELASAWATHVDDVFCSFNDVHAMLAFAGARDWQSAQRLESALLQSQSLATRHGLATRQFGLSACRALIAYARGDYTLAITLFASLASQAHRLGGSHAQRDVLHLTLQQSIERIRRPVRRSTPAPSTPAPSVLAILQAV